MPLWCAASWFGTSLVCVLRVPAALPQRSPMKNLAQHESTTACDFSSTAQTRPSKLSPKNEASGLKDTSKQARRLRTGPEQPRALLSKDKSHLSLGYLGRQFAARWKVGAPRQSESDRFGRRAATLPACGLQRLVCDTHRLQAGPRGAAFTGRKAKPWRRRQQQARRRPRTTN